MSPNLTLPHHLQYPALKVKIPEASELLKLSFRDTI